ncbi:MAG: protein phosphatase 2C domain-containing protein, partial [Anaerolineales bacterium]
MPINPFTVRAAGVSDAGRVRQDNEDNCLVSLEQQLYIVSDGIGGHQAGSIASNIVVSVLPQLIQQRLARVTSPRNRIVELILRETILELSQKLHAESKTKSGLQGMGATVALAYLRYENNFAHLAHMGDSRIYLFRHDRLLQLTEDHSLVTLLVQHGEITPSQVQDHPA